MKKIVSVSLVCFLLLSVIHPAISEASKQYSLAGYDPTQYRSWSSHAFFSSMEELTGIHMELTQYTDANAWKLAKQSMTAGDPNLPDGLFMAQLSSAECLDMLDRAVLVDLAPYIREYCPNLSALMEQYPFVLDAITLPDGRIGALPYLSETPAQNAMWINTKFLNRIRMDIPTNADELVAVLRAFKATDCNGNGKKDEIPLGFLGPFDLKFLAHAFGMVCNDYHIYVEEVAVRFLPTEDRFYDFLFWCADLYREGLLDHDGFSTTDNLRHVTDASKDQVYGILIAPLISSILPADWQKDYTLLMPLEYDGKTVYRDFGTGVIRGTFAITQACDDIPGLLSWVDTMYSESGAVLASVGRKNVDYLVDGDQTWRITESARNNSYYVVTNVLSSQIAYPGYSADAFQRRCGEIDMNTILDELQALNEKCVRPFPSCSLSTQQQSQVSAWQNVIGSTVDTAIGKWVSGEEILDDASFQSFKDRLNEEGLPEFIAFWQEIYDGLNP